MWLELTEHARHTDLQLNSTRVSWRKKPRSIELWRHEHTPYIFLIKKNNGEITTLCPLYLKNWEREIGWGHILRQKTHSFSMAWGSHKIFFSLPSLSFCLLGELSQVPLCFFYLLDSQNDFPQVSQGRAGTNSCLLTCADPVSLFPTPCSVTTL